MSDPDPRSRFKASFGAFLFCAGLLASGSGAARAESWREGAPMTTARAYAGAAVLGDDLYVVGGGGTSGPLSMTEIYDTIGDLWRAAAALPFGLQQFGIAADGGEIYVAGGYAARGSHDDPFEEESDDLWVLDPSVGTWVSGAPMPSSRVALGLAAVGGKIYAIGGKGPGAQRVFVYEPALDRWRVAKAAMPAPRSDMALAIVGDEIYAIGGRDGQGASARVDIYDPVRDAWRAGPSLPAPRAGHAAAVLDGEIHVTGGESLSPPRTYTDHFVLAPGDGTWRRAARLPTPRHAAVAVTVNDRLYVIGGSPGAGVYTVFTRSDVVDIYSSGK